MANRRMFSLDVVDLDSFLEMPIDSQLLYFHLGARADDEGFITPQKVMRVTGIGADSLKVLIAKGFLIPFESGVIVITHWKQNNYIQQDRFKPTVFTEERKKLSCIQNVYKVDTQVRLELGKDTIGADAPIEVVSDKPKKDLAYLEVFRAFSPDKQGWMFHKAQIEAAKRLYIKPGVERVKRSVEFYRENKDDPLCPEIHTPYDLEAKISKLAAYKRKNNL